MCGHIITVRSELKKSELSGWALQSNALECHVDSGRIKGREQEEVFWTEVML